MGSLCGNLFEPMFSGFPFASLFPLHSSLVSLSLTEKATTEGGVPRRAGNSSQGQGPTYLRVRG